MEKGSGGCRRSPPDHGHKPPWRNPPWMNCRRQHQAMPGTLQVSNKVQNITKSYWYDDNILRHKQLLFFVRKLLIFTENLAVVYVNWLQTLTNTTVLTCTAPIALSAASPVLPDVTCPPVGSTPDHSTLPSPPHWKLPAEKQQCLPLPQPAESRMCCQLIYSCHFTLYTEWSSNLWCLLNFSYI